MILWIVLTLMIALAVVGLAVPLIRPGGVLDRRSTTADVLKGQLRDLDAQAAAGLTPPEDIAALRLEIERRALAEGVDEVRPGRPLGEKALLRLAFGLAAVVAAQASTPCLVGQKFPGPRRLSARRRRRTWRPTRAPMSRP